MKLKIPILVPITLIEPQRHSRLARHITYQAIFFKNGRKYYPRAYRKHKRLRSGEGRRSA